jgi:hypothetical protein
MTDNQIAAILTTMLAAGIGVLLLIWTVPVRGATVCLTKSEARQLWPRRHIYWYSKDHCWSNRRGPPRGLRFDPVKDPVFGKAHAEAKPAAPVVKIVRAEDYNELDALADTDTFFKTEPPFPYWAHVMDVDLSRYKTWYQRIETWREK